VINKTDRAGRFIVYTLKIIYVDMGKLAISFV